MAIREHKYNGGYCCVYPIKVNQQRQVVEEVLEFGKPFKFGMEAGSKPELLAVMALCDNDTPIICNGFKDDEYIEMAMLAQKIGRQIIPVVEKYTELALIQKYSRARRRPAEDRHSRQAGQPRFGPLEVFRRLSFQIRSQHNGSDARAAGAARRWGMEDCLQAAPLPSRQPDHEYPPGEGRGDRSRRGSMPSSGAPARPA